MKPLALVLCVLLGFSIFAMLPDAEALSAVTFTSKGIATSVSTSQWQRVYENGTNSIVFLDSFSNGTHNSAIYDIAAKTVSTGKVTLNALFNHENPSSATASSSVGSSSEVIDNTGVNEFGIHSAASTRIGETFTATSKQGVQVADFTLSLKKTGSPTGNANVKIRLVSDDSILFTSSTLDVSTLTTSFVDKTFTFTNAITPGAQFRVLFEYTGGDSSNFINVRNILSDTYADGHLVTGTSGGYNEYTGFEIRASIGFAAMPASKAVDGSTATAWRNNVNSEAGAFIYADMGSTKNVGDVKLYFPTIGAIPQALDVYVSDDTGAFGSVRTTISPTNTAGYQTFLFPAEYSGRYIKLQVNTWGSAVRWNLADFLPLTIGGSVTSDAVSGSIETDSTYFAIARNATAGINIIGKITIPAMTVSSKAAQSSSLTPKDIIQSRTKIYVALIDGSNNLSLGIMNRDFGSYSEVALGDAMLAGGFVHMAVVDGSPNDTVYVYYSDTTNVIKVAKYTNSASILGTTITQSTNADFQIEQLTNKVLVQTDNRFYEHITSTDTITQMHANTFLTKYPQAFTLTPDDLAIVFNGSTQYATAAANTVYDVTTEDFWMAGMFKRTSDSGFFEEIIGKRVDGLGNAGYEVRISDTDKLTAFAHDGINTATATPTSSISTNVWYAWAASFDRDGNVVLYLYNLNTGTLESATAAMSAVGIITNTQTFTVARRSDSATIFFPGTMDNIIPPQIGQTLTQADFLAFAQSGTLPPGTANLYEFENNTNDALGSNNLTTNGSPTFTTRVAGSRTYSSNAVYVANATYATNYTPNTGSSARTGVIVDSTDSGTSTLTAYDEAKFYILNGNAIAVDAASAGATSWNIKAMGTRNQVNITPYSERLNVPLVQNTTLFTEDVFKLVCDAPYDIEAAWQQYMAVGDDSDCTLWRTLADSSATVGRTLPYAASKELVHTSPFTAYTIHAFTGTPTDISITIMYGGKAVDRNVFDDGANTQVRLLYSQCYTTVYNRVSTGEELSSGSLCAGDVTLINTIISRTLGLAFWSSSWGVFHQYNETSNILDVTVRHVPAPFDYTIKITDSNGTAVVDDALNSPTEIDIQTYNLTSFAAGAPLKLEVYNDQGKRVYQYYIDNRPLYLAPVAALFENIEFAGWNILWFIPLVFMGLWSRNTASIGILLSVAVITILNWLGILNLSDPVIWLIAIGGIIGSFATRRLFE